MRFTKSRWHSLVAVSIIMAMYNVVVFVVPFVRGANFWVGYGFTMLAMVITAAVGFFAFDRESAQSKVYRIPLISVVWRYLVIQIIAGLLLMILQFIPFQYGIAANVVILGATLIGLITLNIAREEIERIDGEVKEKVFYIKSLQADVEGLVAKAPDESAKKALKALAETIRYSDPMSSPQLAAIENKIEAKAAILAESPDFVNASPKMASKNFRQRVFQWIYVSR